MPHSKFSELLHECRKGASSYELIGGLFRQMADHNPAGGGHFAGVNYFNGGLFKVVEPIELDETEKWMLGQAAEEDWSLVKPAIFGTLFEGSMGGKERHAFGAHFTSEADIQKVVRPTIVRPWRERIADAKTGRQLLALRQAMLRYHVLDPACGSGNFLYIAYRELKRLELELLEKIYDNFGDRTREMTGGASLVSAGQFFGLDIKEFAVELAKVTLMIGKKLALEEIKERLATSEQHRAVDIAEPDLPLDNLDANLHCDDALFCDWPKADAIIGNPPYLGSRYLAKEHGYDYARRVHAAFPDVPKMADYCVYWFRPPHDTLPDGGRAGLVATNTVRQNETREASLDYVLGHGGTITEAVSSQPWSGEAAVHVSIVNWIKGESAGLKKLFTQQGSNPEAEWAVEELERIPAILSTRRDVTGTVALAANQNPKRCFQGQNPVHEGFFLSPEEAQDFLRKDATLKDVLFPYMIGRDLIERSGPTRWIIDFGRRDMLEAMRTRPPSSASRIRSCRRFSPRPRRRKPRPERKARAGRAWPSAGGSSAITNPDDGGNRRHTAIHRLLPRHQAADIRVRQQHRPPRQCTHRLPDPRRLLLRHPAIEHPLVLVHRKMLHTDGAVPVHVRYGVRHLPVAPIADAGRSTTVADAAVSLRACRRQVMSSNMWSLRHLYRSLDVRGKNTLRDAHESLDTAVREAYSMKFKEDPLAFLLTLNRHVAAREAAGEGVIAPGLPPCVGSPADFTTTDCISEIASKTLDSQALNIQPPGRRTAASARAAE